MNHGTYGGPLTNQKFKFGNFNFYRSPYVSANTPNTKNMIT